MEPNPIKCRVEVNQRQLIYKILSRYSAEFTAFRELLQNADDACASCVLITVTNACVCVRNNGNVFEEEDWKRLASIATGNPNEEAIGFFGVGFYSVFSLSDSPIVSSGSTSMRFFFEGDALYTETSTLSAPQEYTEVQCELKPGVGGWDVNRLSEFLESSMSFPRCIAEVSLTVNDSFKFGIARETSGATALNTTSSQKINSLFNIQAACIRNLRITVKENNSNRTSALTEVSCTVSLKDSNFGLLLGRTMGKNMPVSVPLRLLYPETSDKTRQFMGKIFIGFSTTQTTGSGFHVSSRFIPTVERDSIDMHSPVISVWNRALVSASGSLSRGFYDQCITLSSSDEQEQLLTLHEFKDSAPHVAVSRLLASAFVQNNPILIPSSMGAKPSAEVCIKSEELPVVSGPLAESAQKTLHLLETQKRLLRFGVDDLIKSNQKQLFSYLEGSEMLRWFTSSKVLLGSHQNWMQLVKKVLQSMRLVRPDKQSTDLLCLGSITNHISGDPLSYLISQKKNE